VTQIIEDMIPCFDVVIIGGGPAGTAAALTLLKRQDISVLVLEAGNYDTPKAGESLSPGIRNLMEYLGIWDDFAKLSSVETWGNQAAWGNQDLGSFDFIFNIHGHGWSIDRTRFEHMLAELVIARGGRVDTNTRSFSVERQQSLWCISVNDAQGTIRQIHARCIIDAAGRTSRWNNITHQRYDDLVGISTLLPKPSSQDTIDVTTVETCSDGWWYAAPVPDKRLAVSFMSDTDVIHRKKYAQPDEWLAALHKTRHISKLLPSGEQNIALRTDPAFSACLVPASGLDIIPAGDAAASFDPLSSNGIPHAFATGIQAARVASDRLRGEGQLATPYEEAIAKDFHQYLQTRWRIYAMENRFPDSPFWKRRQTAVSLPPESMLVADPSTASRTIFLPRQITDAIVVSAQQPVAAAQLVGHIGKICPTYPAERIILGIQDMIGRGLSTLTPDSDTMQT